MRVTTKSFALSLAEKNSPIAMPSPILTVWLIDKTLLWEDAEVGEDQLWPDWSSLKVCHYQPGHAVVMCFVHEGGFLDGKGFRRCPRTRLQEITNSSKGKYDMDFLVGMEIEFYIMDESTGMTEPVKTVPNPYTTASLRNSYLPILEEIVGILLKAGIKVRQFHSEGEAGFFEISIEPLPPVEASDALVYSHEAIKTIFSNHGLHATMFPKPFEKLSTVGSHYHLSMSRIDKEEAFLAGLLEHWAALAVFYMPNFDSYSRVRPGARVCWGFRNKTAAIKKIRDGYWELRGVDATANPYLALTAILNAGLLGFEAEKELLVKDPKKIMLKPLDLKEAEDMGMKDTLPSSLKEALERLKANKALLDALGPEIIGRYLKLKTKEEEIFSRLIGSERREISMRLF